MTHKGNHTSLLFLGTSLDKPYLSHLKSVVGAATVYVNTDPISTVYEVESYCERKGITGIITTSQFLLSKLAYKDRPSVDSFAGSFFVTSKGLEVVILSPLAQLITVPYGKFLAARYVSKLIHKEDWEVLPKFSYKLFSPEQEHETLELPKRSLLCAIDIETFKNNLAIRCVGYSFLLEDGSVESTVIPCDSEYNLSIIRALNKSGVPKVFQNGKYDLNYLLRYNAPITAYYYDTATMFHCLYSELPKDLAALSAFFIRESRNWKDMAESSDLATYYEYNARDTYNTLFVCVAWLKQAPKWAVRNYLMEFPLLYPCLLSELTGIKRDLPKLKEVSDEVSSALKQEQTSINKCLGIPEGKEFNTNSPIQMKALLKILGCGDLESADEKNLKKASYRHPLNSLILGKILGVRKKRKLISTYLTPGKEHNGRILYALNPHGTDTGRLASKEHHFWCGLQIQNIPKGTETKSTLVPDNDFLLFECDLEQAESRDTAHVAGEVRLIQAVSCGKDFHSTNASSFFGVPYEDIFDDEKGKTKDKPLRDLAKRVNHGANYLMGANVLVETMGLPAIYKARSLLKLPAFWQPKQIAEYLLAQFHKTYPALSAIFYPSVVKEVITTGMLSSRAEWVSEKPALNYNPEVWYSQTGGWTRRCFGKPDKNKSDLNALVAHVPQSLNAMTLNKAYMHVFYEIALPNVGNFKLCAQIHDSIFGQVRRGHHHLITQVKEAMEIPIKILGYDGISRTFTVPAAAKAGKTGEGALRWSETE